MTHFTSIAAWSWRGKLPDVTGAPRPRIRGKIAALLMLATLAIRLASVMPGIPVLHWHGSITMVHAGGGLPHEHDDATNGGVPHHHDHVTNGGVPHHHHDSEEEELPEDGGESEGDTYYSPAVIPLYSTASSPAVPYERLRPADSPTEKWVCYPLGAMPPGPKRGPPNA
jgi:hypothetical protein